MVSCNVCVKVVYNNVYYNFKLQKEKPLPWVGSPNPSCRYFYVQDMNWEEACHCYTRVVIVTTQADIYNIRCSFVNVVTLKKI